MELAIVAEGKIKAVSQELAQNLPRNTKSPVISDTKFKIPFTYSVFTILFEFFIIQCTPGDFHPRPLTWNPSLFSTHLSFEAPSMLLKLRGLLGISVLALTCTSHWASRCCPRRLICKMGSSPLTLQGMMRPIPIRNGAML